MAPRNDDISLILAKAKKQGWLPDVSDVELDILEREAHTIFNGDVGFPKLNTTLAMSGEYISSPASSVSGITPGNGVLYLIPVNVPRIIDINNLAVNITVAGTAGSVVRLGIYNAGDNNDLPGNLLLDAGTVDTTTTGLKTIAVTQRLYPGRYWFAGVQQGAPATAAGFSMFIGASGSIPASVPAGILSGRFGVGITGALPNTVSLSAADGVSMMRIMARVV